MQCVKNIGAFQLALANWYASSRRPLPWRTEPSVYRTVVSELMAQQTQIKTMLPYFERWMRRFPDFKTLAESAEVDVLKHWEGLGYYSRARNLHKLAKTYFAASPKPRIRAEWQALPGIGPYTSAAIASIAFHEPVAVVDGNVVRILARLSHDTRSFRSNGEAVKAFTKMADQVLNPDNPGDHNQAMMELGATVCLKRKPLCALCPVAAYCQSRSRPEVDEIPKIQRKATEQVSIDRAWTIKEKAILLHRIPDQAGQLAGQYELPKLTALAARGPEEKPILSKSRSITHRRIKENIYRSEAPKRIPADHTWVPLEEIETITLSGPHRRWTRELLQRDLNGSD
ncbi:MAG: A/G-specific adenine glycosylase [Opitutales bacterium]